MDVNEATKSHEFTQSTLDEELGTVKNDIKKLTSDMEELESNLSDPNEVSEKLIKLEDRLRRNNLRIDGLTLNTNETWGDCDKTVQEVPRDKLNIQDNIEFDRRHRIVNRRGSRPRTIICRFVRFKDKQKILQKCQETKEQRNL